MVTITQQHRDFLSVRGYRVVLSDRTDDDAYSVQYPEKREDAYLKHYSHEHFPTRDEAWALAWQDSQTSIHHAPAWQRQMAVAAGLNISVQQ